jgi:hypothetical protein
MMTKKFLLLVALIVLYTNVYVHASSLQDSSEEKAINTFIVAVNKGTCTQNEFGEGLELLDSLLAKRDQAKDLHNVPPKKVLGDQGVNIEEAKKWLPFIQEGFLTPHAGLILKIDQQIRVFPKNTPTRPEFYSIPAEQPIDVSTDAGPIKLYAEEYYTSTDDRILHAKKQGWLNSQANYSSLSNVALDYLILVHKLLKKRENLLYRDGTGTTEIPVVQSIKDWSEEQLAQFAAFHTVKRLIRHMNTQVGQTHGKEKLYNLKHNQPQM